MNVQPDTDLTPARLAEELRRARLLRSLAFHAAVRRLAGLLTPRRRETEVTASAQVGFPAPARP